MPETPQQAAPQSAPMTPSAAPQILDEAPIVTARNKARNGIEEGYNWLTAKISTAHKVWKVLTMEKDPGDAPESPLWQKPFRAVGSLYRTVVTPLRAADRIATPAFKTVDHGIRATGNAVEMVTYPAHHPINTLKAATIIGAGDALKDQWQNTKDLAGNVAGAAGDTVSTAAAAVSEPVESIHDVTASLTHGAQHFIPEPIDRYPTAGPRWVTGKARSLTRWIRSIPGKLWKKLKDAVNEMEPDPDGLSPA